jgi:signal transduction histidine kinase/ActR/RegA family two-component response regulator
MSRAQFQIPKPPQLPTIRRYATAPLITALMVVLQYLVLPDPHLAPFMFSFLGVTICAWLAGRWPGVLTATLSAVTSNYLFVAPHRGWALSHSALTVTSVFLLAASATALLCGSLRDAMLIAEEAATELLEGQRLLREADEHKDHFISVLSHELRNPLSPIVNALFILDEAPPGGELAARARAIIARQVQHLTRIVDDLLDVTRISRGKVEIRRICVNLVEIVERTLQDYGALFTDRKCRLERSLPSQAIWVMGDPTRLAQILSNLLTNSAKFASGACIWVTVEQRGGEAIIRVRDNGAGMPAELLAHVFEPFVQADHTLARTAGGLGLGLALVKGLVELHGGRVSAFSDGEGTGSEFTVVLPVVQAPSSTADGQSVPRATTTRRILVIEDNVDAAVSLKSALELAGHEVALEYDGPAGLAKARAWRPEIVLCDIGLPSMSGYEVAQQLRADRERPFLLALTGYALPEDQEKARQAGFDSHLAKPPSLAELVQLIAEAKQPSPGAQTRP